MAVKVKALITLVVGKAQEFAPGQECEVSDEEAKRLVTLGFAERVKKAPAPQNLNNKPQTNKPDENNGTTNDCKQNDENSSGQSISETGTTS